MARGMRGTSGAVRTPAAAPGGVTGDKKISNLKKPGKRDMVKGIGTVFSNRIANFGGKR